MKPETPNETNWRKLAERFLYNDRIVYDDGNEQFTLEMLREKTVMVKTVNQEDYSWKWLYGDEAILFLLKSDVNRVRNEIQDVVKDLEMENGYEFVECHGNGNYSYLKNENEPLYTIEIDYGDEPLIMKQIDENGNETVRKIEKTIGNGLETRFIFVDENENGNEKHCGNGIQFRNGIENENELGFENELRNELIKENQTKNETKNGIIDITSR